MIKVSALNKAFGGLRAVRNLSFEAAPHRVTSIIGPNGAGKSTAFNLIAGTLRPNSGTVELEGRDITGQAPFALARLGVARSVQITNLFFGLERSRERPPCLSDPRTAPPLSRPIGSPVPAAGARSSHSRGVRAAGAHERARWKSLARRSAPGRDRSLHGAWTPPADAG